MKRILNTILFSGLIVSSFPLNAMEGAAGKQEETKKPEDITVQLYRRLIPGFVRTRLEAAQDWLLDAAVDKAIKKAAKKVEEKTPAFLKGKQVDKIVASMIIAGVLYLACKRLAVEEDGIKKMAGGLGSLALLYLGITEFVVGGQTVKLSPKDKNPVTEAVGKVARDVMGAEAIPVPDREANKIEPTDVGTDDHSAGVISTTAVTAAGTVDAIANPNGLDAFFAWFGK